MNTRIRPTESHPKGLWFVTVAASLLSVSFGGINALLVLYATTMLHIDASKAYILYATYNSLLFTLPLIGGAVSEKLGYRQSFVFGIFLCVMGAVVLSLIGIQTMYLGLGLYVTGVAIFVPTYLVMVGKLYAKNDKRREGGFTLAYIITNIGFLIAGLTSGYLTQLYGYSITFRIFGAVTLAGIALYFIGKHQIVPHKGRTLAPQLKANPLLRFGLLILSAVIVGVAAAWMIEHARASNILLFILIGLVTALLIFTAFKRPTKEKRKLIAFIILSYFSVGFWALYTLEPSLLTLFIKTNVNRHLFGFLIPPSTFYGLDPFFIIILGAVFSYLWVYLHRKKKNPSLPLKFTLSLLGMGVGFLIFVIGITLAPRSGLSHIIWIVLGYFFLSASELFIGPIGNSMVGRLSPEGMEGRLMGVWQLFTGCAGALSGYLAQLAVVPKHMHLTATNPIYSAAFLKIGLMAIAVGLISFAMIPLVKKLIR